MLQAVWTTKGAKLHEPRERETANKRGRFRGGSQAFAPCVVQTAS